MASEPLTVSDREAFRGYLRRTAPLDDADLAAIEVHARIRRLPAHAAFLTCGERAVDCATVLAGVLREYYRSPTAARSPAGSPGRAATSAR